MCRAKGSDQSRAASVSLSWLGSFRSVRRECGAIEFDEVAYPAQLGRLHPWNRKFLRMLNTPIALKSQTLTATGTGANPSLDRCDGPIFVDPFDARI